MADNVWFGGILAGEVGGVEGGKCRTKQYDIGMRVNEVAVRMVYETLRDSFLRFYEKGRVASAPADLPQVFHETYLRGYGCGHRNGLSMHPAEISVPPELAGEFEGAWTLGYEAGMYMAEVYAEILLRQTQEFFE